uniref:Sushi domain-containing protein n=1 Tax=Salarias fasciatus TaxID=181472 RepID=A0A672GX62_SALFA
MEPASPLLSAGFIMVCFLGAVRLSTGDESHCPCPKIPPWPLTEDPPEKCHQISDTFRYTCLVGYVRKAGTSNLIKCELKNKVGQWQNSTLQCIDDPKRPKLPTTPQSTTPNDPKRPKLPTTPQSTTPKNLSDNPQDTTMTSTAKSSTSVYMKQSTVSQEGKTGDKVDDKAHDAVTPTPGKIRKAETTTTRNGTSNPYADPTAAHSAGTQAAAIVSPILLVLICAAIGIGFILHWRKSRHNLPQQPGEELVPMNPACGLPS